MKKKLFIVLTTLFLIVFVIMVFELCIRYSNSNYKNANEYFYSISDNVLTDKKLGKCKWRTTLYPHPYLGIVHKKDGNKDCLTSEINFDGLYSDGYPQKRSKKYFNVLVVGGSVAYNLIKSYPKWNTYGALRNSLENKFLSADGKIIRVFGGAIGSWKQPQQLFNYILHQEKFDAILSVEGANELSIGSDKKFSKPLDTAFQIGTYPDIDIYLNHKVLKTLYSIQEKFKELFLFPWLIKSWVAITNKTFEEKLKNSLINKYFSEQGYSKEKIYLEYSKYIETFNVLTKKNHQFYNVFLQPTIHQKITLTKEEKKFYFENLTLEKLYPEVSSKITKNKKYVSNLLYLFTGNKKNYYKDYVHFLHGDKNIPGHVKIVEGIMKVITKDWGLKEKK